LTQNVEILDILQNAKLTKDPLEVVPDHMKWMLNNVFGKIPRNHKYDIKRGLDWKSTMSGYIWYNFGSHGYLTCHQMFKARQFLHEFDKVCSK
jgi:hypothetical protein